MSDTDVDSKTWLEALQRALAPEPSGSSLEGRILSFVRSIDERYRTNFALEPGQQLPLMVFRRLIERLEAVVAAAATPALHAGLRGLPEQTFGRASLVDAARARLLDQLDQVLASAPGTREARIARAELRLDAKDAAGAADDFAAVVSQDDDNWTARHGEIRALIAGRRDVDALARLDELVRRRPDDAFARHERARLLLRYNHLFEALIDIERLVQVSQDPETRLWGAQQLLLAGRARDAAAICAELPQGADGLVILGKARLDLDETTGAIEALEGVLAHVRELESLQRAAGAEMNALTLLGHAHARIGRPARALDFYIQAMAVFGSNYELRRAMAKLPWEALSIGEGAPPAEQTPDDAAFDERWIEPNMRARFSDGKPIEVTSDDLMLAPYLERLPWVQAVERLILNAGGRDNREAFVALFRLELPQLRHIEIEAEHFGFPCLFRMVEAPFFARLEGLNLAKCDLDLPALELLAERIPPGLHELSVTSATARPALPRASRLADLLRRWDLSRLETLDLSDCELGPDEVIALTEARLPSLVTLELAGNDLRSLDVARFLESALVRRLHGLHISDTGIESELLLGLLDHLDGSALQWIRAERRWSDDELNAVVNHPAYRRLDHVELGIKPIPDEAWLALLD